MYPILRGVNVHAFTEVPCATFVCFVLHIAFLFTNISANHSLFTNIGLVLTNMNMMLIWHLCGWRRVGLIFIAVHKFVRVPCGVHKHDKTSLVFTNVDLFVGLFTCSWTGLKATYRQEVDQLNGQLSDLRSSLTICQGDVYVQLMQTSHRVRTHVWWLRSLSRSWWNHIAKEWRLLLQKHIAQWESPNLSIPYEQDSSPKRYSLLVNNWVRAPRVPLSALKSCCTQTDNPRHRESDTIVTEAA